MSFARETVLPPPIERPHCRSHAGVAVAGIATVVATGPKRQDARPLARAGGGIIAQIGERAAVERDGGRGGVEAGILAPP